MKKLTEIEDREELIDIIRKLHEQENECWNMYVEQKLATQYLLEATGISEEAIQLLVDSTNVISDVEKKVKKPIETSSARAYLRGKIQERIAKLTELLENEELKMRRNRK